MLSVLKCFSIPIELSIKACLSASIFSTLANNLPKASTVAKMLSSTAIAMFSVFSIFNTTEKMFSLNTP